MGKPFTLSRSTTINAAPEAITPLLRDFREWVHWSPWEGLDDNLQRTYTGPDAGVGAHYAWSGNAKAGRGEMTVTRDEPGVVEVDLRFEKPFPAHNRVEFVLTPDGAGATKVQWLMHGEMNPLMRLMSLVKSMDSMMGPDFEKGLARLKARAEA